MSYLNRCRLARYGDCDVHALETAMLLIHLGIVDADHVHIMNDQKWGHTFVKISAHPKCPFECVLDAWGDNIAATLCSLKKYNSYQKLFDGSPALKHETRTEKFTRNPDNIRRYSNSLIQDAYSKKTTAKATQSGNINP